MGKGKELSTNIYVGGVIWADPRDTAYAAYQTEQAPYLISFPVCSNIVDQIHPYFILHFKYVYILRFLLDSKFDSWNQVSYFPPFLNILPPIQIKKKNNLIFNVYTEYTLECTFLPTTASVEHGQKTGDLYLFPEVLFMSISSSHTCFFKPFLTSVTSFPSSPFLLALASNNSYWHYCQSPLSPSFHLCDMNSSSLSLALKLFN